MPLHIFTESLIGVASPIISSKVTLGLSILILLEKQYKILSNTNIYHVVLRLVPRSIRSPTVNITSMIRKPLKIIASIENPKTVNEVFSLSLRKTYELGSVIDAEGAMIRGLELEYDFITKVLDEPASGSLIIRGTGLVRKYHGDIELNIFIPQRRLHDISKVLTTLASETKEYWVYEKMKDLSNWLFNPTFPRGIGKKMYVRVNRVILGPAGSIKNVKERIVSGHKSIRGFITDIVNMVLNERKNEFMSLTREPKDIELKLLWHLYHINKRTLIPHFENNMFITASERLFREENYQVSLGSFIVVTMDGSTIEKGYKKYLEEVLVPFVEPLPNYKLFRDGVNRGFERIKRFLHSRSK